MSKETKIDVFLKMSKLHVSLSVFIKVFFAYAAKDRPNDLVILQKRSQTFALSIQQTETHCKNLSMSNGNKKLFNLGFVSDSASGEVGKGHILR